jgi:MoaA/NifB/PqqE/SkfB family radical SAM enzyme
LARAFFNLSTLGKLVFLFRDHSPSQITNTLRFGSHALRGFRATHLPYDPMWLSLDTTARCNLQCRHCVHGNPENLHKPQFCDMTMDTFRQILDRFPRAISVSLGGGEPFLNPNLLDMIHLAHERRMRVHINTNGTLLQSNIDALLEAPLEYLCVSLYGTDAPSFTQVTGARGSLLDEVLNGVQELVARRPPGGYPHLLRTSYICTRPSLSQAIEFVRLSESLGVDSVKLRNLCLYGLRGRDESMCLYEDDPIVQAWVDDLRRQHFGLPVSLPGLYPRSAHGRHCTRPFQLLNIGGDGSIGPCAAIGSHSRWGHFLDPGVWNGPTMAQIRRPLCDPAQPLPAICRHCENMIPRSAPV